MRLIAAAPTEDGWAKVSNVVWPLITTLPDDLVEKRVLEDSGVVRLTEAGEIILRYNSK